MSTDDVSSSIAQSTQLPPIQIADPASPGITETPVSQPIPSQNKTEGEHTPIWLTILTVFLLLTLTIAGLIIMWLATKWPKSVKWTLTTICLILPVILVILGILAIAVLASINPARQISRGRDTARQAAALELFKAVEQYYANVGSYPTDQDTLVAGGYLKEIQTDPQTKAPIEYRLTNDGNDCELVVFSETAKENITITCLDPDFSPIVSTKSLSE